MTYLFDSFVSWLISPFRGYFQRKVATSRFKLTRETIDQVMIYGGIQWDDEGLRQELQLCKDKNERDRLILSYKLNREFIETERNRERFAHLWYTLKPEQIQMIEDKINRGERLEAIDVKAYFTHAQPVRKEMDY